MSTTVSLLPFLLIYSAGASIINFSNMAKRGLSTINGEKIHLNQKDIEEMLNQDFETNIMDKDVLLKTITEYGATNIQEHGENIICDCEEFHIEFYKQQDKPYIMNITYTNEENLEELVNNISNDYTTNAQEVSYNKIKERLEAQNMKISEEEIYDDNTIVLTVNLE